MFTQLCIVTTLICTLMALPLIRPKRAAGSANLDGNYGDNSIFRNQPGTAGQPTNSPFNSGYNSQYNDINMDTLRYTGDIDNYNRNGGYQNSPSGYNSRDGYDSRYNNNNNNRNSNNSPYYYGSTPGYERNGYNSGYNSNSNMGFGEQNDRYSDSRYNNNNNNIYSENREQQNNGNFFNRTGNWFKDVFGRK